MTDNIIYVDFIKKKRIYPEQTEFGEKSQPSEKQAIFEELMSVGMVRVSAVGEFPGLSFPKDKIQPVIVSNWSYKFQIPDLVIDAKGISGTLTFNGAPFLVEIPWGAIVAMCSTANPEKTIRTWSPDNV